MIFFISKILSKEKEYTKIFTQPEAQIATTSIVFLRYMMIAESVCLEHDERTWGEIFFRFCDEVKDIEYVKAVKLLIDTIIDILRQAPVLTDIQA